MECRQLKLPSSLAKNWCWSPPSLPRGSQGSRVSPGEALWLHATSPFPGYTPCHADDTSRSMFWGELPLNPVVSNGIHQRQCTQTFCQTQRPSIGFYSSVLSIFPGRYFPKRQGIFMARQLGVLITLGMHGRTLWGKSLDRKLKVIKPGISERP